MKKLSFIALMLLMVVGMTSCEGLFGGDENKIDESLIVGKWKTADGTYFEVYNSDGTGKYWNLNDDVTEEEASNFTWEFSILSDDKFIQYHENFSGSLVPQYCNILELTSTTFKYNNEGLRATYNLIRAN
ncbi:MAG: hypothetical protein IJA42_07190 [Bacteroidales bacterium]|nr:hypothetical protein [Bacteroidales bacterium]